MRSPVRLLALNWSLDQPPSEIHRICADRTMERGTNHQTLHEQGRAHEGVLWKFLQSPERLAEGEADTVIEMDVREDLEQGLARATDSIVRVLGLPHPDTERVGAALAKAREYRPSSTDAQANSKQRKAAAPPGYFGLLAEIDLVDALDAQITAGAGAGVVREFW